MFFIRFYIFFFVFAVRVIKLDDDRRRRHSNRSAVVVVAVVSCILHVAYAPVKPSARAPPTARPGRTPQQKKTAQKRIRGIFSFRIFSRSSSTVTTVPQRATDAGKNCNPVLPSPYNNNILYYYSSAGRDDSSPVCFILSYLYRKQYYKLFAHRINQPTFGVGYFNR